MFIDIVVCGRPPYRMPRRGVGSLLRNSIHRTINGIGAVHLPLQIGIIILDTGIDYAGQSWLIRDIGSLRLICTNGGNAPGIIDVGVRIRGIFLRLADRVPRFPFCGCRDVGRCGVPIANFFFAEFATRIRHRVHSNAICCSPACEVGSERLGMCLHKEHTDLRI